MKNKLKLMLAMPVLFSALAAAANECSEHARNPMEVSYCQVKASRYGGSLPSLYRFRKNSEKTQRLILKNPAQRAGVDLPPEIASPKRKQANIEHSMPEKKTRGKQQQVAAAQRPQAPSKAGVAHPLSACVLQQQQQQIQCSHGGFKLLNNRRKNQLQPGALERHNRLILPRQQHPNYIAHSKPQYLSQLYQIYLAKMLEIGLAGATMSYTKFVGTYQLHVNNGIDPRERFTTMFELLKNERKVNSVKARYNDQFPQNIEQCMHASNSLIVCDDVQNNWVFSK
ncbi:MAG: hypothetical protein KTR17_03495 [Cellvibrionaceae bacterium]|nr:hypothetical protein [Cellvibrionaceae bacterium]